MTKKELKDSYDSLEKMYDNLYKEYVNARQERMEIKKQLNDKISQAEFAGFDVKIGDWYKEYQNDKKAFFEYKGNRLNASFNQNAAVEKEIKRLKLAIIQLTQRRPIPSEKDPIMPRTLKQLESILDKLEEEEDKEGLIT